MHIARFLWRDRVRWGILANDELHTIRGRRYRDARPGRSLCPVSEATLLAPIEPSNKVVAVAVNYGERAERDGPGVFMKQPGAIAGHLDPILYPRIAQSIVHEAEVGIVIGRTARKTASEDALDHVLGYTCVNDVTASELTNSDIGRGGSMRGKHFDTFCPIGPVIATGLDGDNLRIECRVNGEPSVDGSSRDMIWGVAELISWVSEVMTLNPGDIICSGCPGVDAIKPGDAVEVQIEGIGTLRNPVMADI